LSLKPIFDSLSVEEFRTWKGWEPIDLPEGGQSLHVPYPDYHPVVSQWFDLLYQTPFYIDPYAALPEDPTPDGVPFSVMGAHFPPEYFENATLDQVRRYMLLCTRGEKFCDGHIAGEFESGVIQAAFSRLEILEKSMRGNEVQWVRFDQLAAKYANGGTPPSSRPECWGGDIGFISTAWIAEDQTEVWSSPRTITHRGVESCSTRIIEPNALLVGTRVGVGKAAVNRVSLAISQDITAVRLKPLIDPIFAAFAFKTESAQAHFRGRKRGATIQGVSRGDLQELLLPLHSAESQLGIVQTLEAIQAARLARLREIELERERKAALMAHLFAYGTQNEPRRDTPLGLLPERWEVVDLGSIARVSSGGTPDRKKPEYWGGSMPWVKTGEIDYQDIFQAEEFITELGMKNSSARLVPAGTLLMAMYGQGVTRGKVAVLRIDATINQACAAIATSEKVDTRFLFRWLEHRYEAIRSQSHGAQQQNLNAGLIKDILVPLPANAEQSEIAHALDRSSDRIEAIEA
jgi:type I restriction enzyme S subunit